MRVRNLSDEWWLVEAHYAYVVYSIIEALEYNANKHSEGGYGALEGLCFFTSFRFLWRDQIFS